MRERYDVFTKRTSLTVFRPPDVADWNVNSIQECAQHSGARETKYWYQPKCTLVSSEIERELFFISSELNQMIDSDNDCQKLHITFANNWFKMTGIYVILRQCRTIRLWKYNRN